MAVTPSEELTFDVSDLTEPVRALDRLAAASKGWVNFLPEVVEGLEPPQRNPVVAIFSARGEPVPLATWSAPSQPGRRATVGIEHGSGPRALDRLEASGIGLRDGWLKVSDHPRRGLVVTAPASASTGSVLGWLLAAAEQLSVAPLTGAWLASVYEG